MITSYNGHLFKLLRNGDLIFWILNGILMKFRPWFTRSLRLCVFAYVVVLFLLLLLLFLVGSLIGCCLLLTSLFMLFSTGFRDTIRPYLSILLLESAKP